MMFYEEIAVFVVYALPHVFSTPCMAKCGIPSEWQSVATNVCYGTTEDDFGKFTMDRNCNLFAIRLTHVSGFHNGVSNDVSRRSRWGYNSKNPNHICTLILKDRKALIPKEAAVKPPYYSLDGFKVENDVIIVKQNETFIAGQELEIAFCFDYTNQRETTSEGTHCVNVDVSCYV